LRIEYELRAVGYVKPRDWTVQRVDMRSNDSRHRAKLMSSTQESPDIRVAVVTGGSGGIGGAIVNGCVQAAIELQ
jgi:hypothetical protein